MKIVPAEEKNYIDMNKDNPFLANKYSLKVR